MPTSADAIAIPNGAGAGVRFISPKGEQLKYVLQLLFKATNNAAEYEALIHGLQIAVTLGIKHLLAYGDSKFIIQQVNKDWECTKEKMDAYCREIGKLEAKFYGLEFHHVSRDDNAAADVLSKLGSKRSIVPPGMFVHALNSPTVKMEEDPPTKPDLVRAIGQEVLTLDTDWRPQSSTSSRTIKAIQRERNMRSLLAGQATTSS